MGAWGTALYSDDTACDVRDDYVQNLKHGHSGEDSARQVIEGYADLLADREVACLVYFALADTSWRYGRLTEAVKTRALELIAQGGDVFVWLRDSPGDAKGRSSTIKSLDARLRSPQPAPKVVKTSKPKPKKVWTTAPVGSVFLLELPGGGHAALVLAGFLDLGKSLDPVFSVPAWRGATAPTASELGGKRMKTLRFASGLGPQEHVGIIPNGRASVMAGLVPTKTLLGPEIRFDPDSVVFTDVQQIAKEIDAQL